MATHTYNALNQIRPVPSTAASLYDLDGNQRVTIAGWQHHWDAANRLTNSVNGAHQIVNTFDSDHRRVRKQVYADGALTADTTFVYDGWYLVAELTHTPTHATTNLYVWGADRYGMHNETPGVASKDSSGGVRALLAIVASGSDKTPEVFYPVMNDHGDVMALLDVTGSNIVARYEYDPWGNVLSATGPAATLCPFRWQTKYFDNETRLYYFGYRFFDSLTGRWLSRDPIAENGGVNLYAFCNNDPVNGVDGLGLYDKVKLGASIGFSLSFNGMGKPQFSAMLIGSAKESPCEIFRFNADAGIRLMRGGMLGTPRNSSQWVYEVFGAISGTIGNGNGKATPFYFNGSQMGSVLGDTYDNSFSAGQTFYYNSALNESVRMGLLRFQSGGYFLNYSNDQKHFPYGLGDGGDRGWTGGGALGFSIGDGQFGMLAFDAFTGSASALRDFNPNDPNEQTPYSLGLNQAQWFFGISGSAGNLFGLSVDAPNRFNIQHWIHSTISLEAGYFQYPQDIQFRLRMSGSIPTRKKD